MSHLKAVIQHLIQEEEAQADVLLKQYIVAKTQEVLEAVRAVTFSDNGIRRPKTQAERDSLAKDVKDARNAKRTVNALDAGSEDRRGVKGGNSDTGRHGGPQSIVRTTKKMGDNGAELSDQESRNDDKKASAYNGRQIMSAKDGKGR